VAWNSLYKTTFHAEPPEAYERLIFDAIFGDQTLFIRGDEAEAAWGSDRPHRAAMGVKQGWPQPYAPNTWGPQDAMDLIELDGRRWLHSKDEDQPIIACSL